MNIKVDRTNTPEGDLVFTVMVSEPHLAKFGKIEEDLLRLLDLCQHDVNQVTTQDDKFKNDILLLIHSAKEKAFMRVLDNLKFSIENEFRPKFKPICQEIYNWIQDKQEGNLKKWMNEFDPQRTKYYFDNDITADKFHVQQESEHENEDDEDEDDE